MRAMSNTPDTSNTMAAETFDGHSVIAVSFEDDGTAYKALTLLEELDSQHRVDVREAVVVARGEDGQIVAKDRVESSSLPGTATGGLIGLLIGVIGGPLGMLVGGTYGLFAGSMFDLYDADESDSALGEISSSVKIGDTALLAVVDEQSTEVVDAAMADLGGTVARRSVAVVEAEIAAAEDAERKAKREARKELNRARRERNKEAVDAKLDELKSKLHHGQPTESAEADAAPAGRAR
jgi:uncharacterized membrane protein